jgi:hypothetical protein
MLRNALPGFLQLAATNSSILVEQPNGDLAVSFPRTLAATHHELLRFVMYDVVSAFLLGLPPLVDYAHDSECGSSFINHVSERIHGIPAAFLQIISWVNSWRARPTAYLDSWRALEGRVLSWKSPYSTNNGSIPSSDTIGVARDTLQEGWRHVLLIYIYMVCFLELCHASIAHTGRKLSGYMWGLVT